MLFSNKRKAAIKKIKNLVFTTKDEVYTFREKIENLFSVPILPNNVECKKNEFGKIECDMLIPELHSSDRLILYIHGGSFVAGSNNSYRGFCASFANITATRVALPNFRLSPAFAFPSGVEDIQTCFRALYLQEKISLNSKNKTVENVEKKPEIIIAADGSGAVLALAFLANLKARYKKSIKQVILFSPWLNLSDSAEIFKIKRNSDEVISAENIRCASEQYTFSSNFENGFVSPFFAADDIVKEFPPFYIQMGEKEILLPDVKAYQKKLQNLGIECTIDIWKDMMYMFQMADEELQEAHEALEKIGKMITARKSDPEDFFADYSTPVKRMGFSED